MRVGRVAIKRNLPASAVFPPQGTPRPQEGRDRSRGLDPAVYHVLKNHAPYQDLGPDYFVKRDPARIAAKLAQCIKELGYEVQYSAAA